MKITLSREAPFILPMWCATIDFDDVQSGFTYLRRKQALYAFTLQGIRRRTDHYLRAQEWFEDPTRFVDLDQRIALLEQRLGIGEVEEVTA